MSSIWRIRAAGVRIVSVPPVTSRRSAPVGNHTQTRRIHEPESHQVQQDRVVAPIDHRLEEGAELGRRERVHLAA